MYKSNGQNSVTRLSDGAIIPFVNGNRDYEEYKQWVDDGGVPEPEFTKKELARQALESKIQAAKQYLNDTDFYMTVDKYATLSEEVKTELTNKRAAARDIINSGK